VFNRQDFIAFRPITEILFLKDFRFSNAVIFVGQNKFYRKKREYRLGDRSQRVQGVINIIPAMGKEACLATAAATPQPRDSPTR